MCIYVLGHMFTRVLFCMAQVYRCIPTLQGICLRMFFFNFSGHMLTRVFRRFAWQPVSCRAHAYVFTFWGTGLHVYSVLHGTGLQVYSVVAGHMLTCVFCCFAWHRFTCVFHCCRAHVYFSGHMFTCVCCCFAWHRFTCVFRCCRAHAYMCTYFSGHMYIPCPKKQNTIRVNMAHVYSDLIFRVRFLPVFNVSKTH